LLLAGIDVEPLPRDHPSGQKERRIPRLFDIFWYIQFFYFVRFHTDPSGTYIRVEYKAIGAAAEGAQNILAEEYFKVWSV
jgi:hypothetical protein